MARRALLKFRNPDSTQDLNDRYIGLFDKGYFSGGELKAVNGALKVDLWPFATAGADGMFVREDSETTRLSVLAGFRNYIVIRQEYISNADPVLSIESLTQSQFEADGADGAKGHDNPTLIVFGVVDVPAETAPATPTVSVDQNYIETYESDIVDVLGRSPFRGLLDAAINLPTGLNANRAGDYYVITDGTGDVPLIFAWNGISWVNITNADSVLTLLNAHRQNEKTNEKHLTDAQLDAAAGSSEGATGAPSDDNRYVVEFDTRLLTQDEADANQGNGLVLEDFGPSDSNRWISSAKVFAVPTEVEVTADLGNFIELPAIDGGFYVGYYNATTGDTDAVAGTAHQWFNVYAEDYSGDEEYTNDDFNEVQVMSARFGDSGLTGIALISETTEIDPVTNTDDLGFYVPSSGKSVYLALSHPLTGPARVAYGKRGYLGALLPHQLMNRGPKGGQIDTRIARLLFGTPNAQFESALIWDEDTFAGDVVAWNSSTAKFVLADPDNLLGDGAVDPVGVRGNFNNLIMEGLYTADSSFPYTVGRLYADKANPGSLTNIENEWFIGRAISATQLLVNMNAIALTTSDPTTPVTFPEDLFQNSLQAGETCYWNGSKFDKADTVTNLPLGIRGNDNNVIQSGEYSALGGTPFVSGTRYYAGASPGFLITAENDWFIGIGISSTTLLVNANAVPIPSKWTDEHYSDSGYHKFKIGDSTDRDNVPSPGTGMLFIRSDTPNPSIEYWTGSAWASATTTISSIPSGSKMLFVQDTVPTGWTLDTTVVDKVIRVVDDAVDGGVTGGSWTISGISGAGHQLTVAEMPSHDHELIYTTITPGAGNFQLQRLRNSAGYPGNSDQNSNPVVDTGGDDAHSHVVSSDGTWRPSYINAIICIKD
jgi:hypothetical protein